jgi:hypothetical protein
MITLKLPTKVLIQLNQRLRTAQYGELIPTSNWLHELGHPISKSAVGRYAMRLRTLDARNSVPVAAILETPIKARGRSKISGLRGHLDLSLLEKDLLENYRKMTNQGRADLIESARKMAH